MKIGETIDWYEYHVIWNVGHSVYKTKEEALERYDKLRSWIPGPHEREDDISNLRLEKRLIYSTLLANSRTRD